MVQTTAEMAQQFDQINKWLLVLLRRRHRVAYEYMINEDESEVTFRIGGPIAESIWHSFVFRVRDLKDSPPMSCLSGCSSGGFAQFTFTMPELSEPQVSWRRSNLLLVYFAQNSLALLKHLPTRSEAAVEGFPILDEEAIARAIASRGWMSEPTGEAS
jgi:hypothetical protein